MNTMDALGTEDAARWGYRTLMGQNRRGVVLTPEQQGAAAGQGQTPYPTGVAPTNAPPVTAPPVAAPGYGGNARYGRGRGEVEPDPVPPPDVTPPPGSTPPGTTPPPGTPPPPPGVPPPPTYGNTPRTDLGSGAGGGYAYTGFDFTQDPNNRLIGKSAKYSFAEATKAAEAAGAGDVWKTKEGAQYFAEKYIAPKLKEAGFEVIDIKGDKMFVRDWEDRANGHPGRWVDFVVNADGENPALAWQVENGGGVYGQEKKFDSRADAGTSPYAPPPADGGASGADSGISDQAYERLAERRNGRGKRLSDIV